MCLLSFTLWSLYTQEIGPWYQWNEDDDDDYNNDDKKKTKKCCCFFSSYYYYTTTTTTTTTTTHSCCCSIVVQMEGVGTYYKHSVENTQKGHWQLYRHIYWIPGSHSIKWLSIYWSTHIAKLCFSWSMSHSCFAVSIINNMCLWLTGSDTLRNGKINSSSTNDI